MTCVLTIYFLEELRQDTAFRFLREPQATHNTGTGTRDFAACYKHQWIA